MKRTIVTVSISIAIIAAVVFVIFEQSTSSTNLATVKASLQKAFFIDGEQRKTLPVFTLTDQNGDVFNEQQLNNHWSLLFLGFTHCPDVCPTELMMLSQVKKTLSNNSETVPNIVFISVDGYRDTAQKLKIYTQFFDPDFTGVKGERKMIDTLAQALGAYYEFTYKQDDQDGKTIAVRSYEQLPAEVKNSYLVNHTAAIYLINPDGQLHGVFQTPHSASIIASDVAQIIKYYR